jgi:hypothetical protein
MKVITICGSVTRSPKSYWDVHAQKLTLEGHIVLTVNVWGLRDWLHNDPEGQEAKKTLDRVHKAKIKMSDEVHVLMERGYLGDSTGSEIDYAESLGVPVWYVENGEILE